MKINFEYELNRGWIIDEDGEIIGETNFVVPADWLVDLFCKTYSDKYDNFDVFEDTYEPETEGEFIYQEAIKDKVLMEDLGIIMY